MGGNPGDEQNSAQHHEGGDLGFIRRRKRQDPAVTRLPVLDELRRVGLVFMEGHWRCRVIHVPAEAAIIEVDDLHGAAVDQQIGQPEIGVYQAEAVGPHAVVCKSPPDQVNGALKESLACAVEPHTVAPAAPVRPLLAECCVKIPGEAGEPLGSLPLPGMHMHARSDFAQGFEGAREIILDAGLDPVFPVEQHHVARALHARMSGVLDQLAVGSRQRIGCYRNAGLPQVHGPCQFRGDGLTRLVTFTVNAQGPAAPVGRVDAIGGILRKIQQAGRAGLGQVVMRHRPMCQIEQDRKLLRMGEGVEIGHAGSIGRLVVCPARNPAGFASPTLCASNA